LALGDEMRVVGLDPLASTSAGRRCHRGGWASAAGWDRGRGTSHRPARPRKEVGVSVLARPGYSSRGKQWHIRAASWTGVPRETGGNGNPAAPARAEQPVAADRMQQCFERRIMPKHGRRRLRLGHRSRSPRKAARPVSEPGRPAPLCAGAGYKLARAGLSFVRAANASHCRRSSLNKRRPPHGAPRGTASGREPDAAHCTREGFAVARLARHLSACRPRTPRIARRDRHRGSRTTRDADSGPRSALSHAPASGGVASDSLKPDL